jgi:hypothetical protein
LKLLMWPALSERLKTPAVEYPPLSWNVKMLVAIKELILDIMLVQYLIPQSGS